VIPGNFAVRSQGSVIALSLLDPAHLGKQRTDRYQWNDPSFLPSSWSAGDYGYGPVIDQLGMRCDKRTQTGPTRGGEWGLMLPEQFGANSEFYVQMRIRWNDAMMNTFFVDAADHVSAQAGLKAFDMAAGGISTTNEAGKIVLCTPYQHRFFSIYTYQTPQGVADTGILEVVNGGTDYKYQNDVACLYSELRNGQPSGCFYMRANEWITMQLGVQIFGDSPISPASFWDWRCRLWMGYQGESQILLHDFNPQTPGYFPLSKPMTTPGLGKIFIFPYMTRQDPAQVHDLAQVWFKEIIVAKNFIADPVDGSTSVAPSNVPAWRAALVSNQLTDIATNTASQAYTTAGYKIAGWLGDASDDSHNLTAWGGGVINPYLGQWGTLLCGANGHEPQPASTIHSFDIATATWTTPIGPPKVHRQVAPDYAPPPPDAECWYCPEPAKVGITDLSNYRFIDSTGAARYGLDAILTEAKPINAPFALTGYAYARWPLTYMMRLDTNVGTGMRYDEFVIIPPEAGGEANGTLCLMSPNFGMGMESYSGFCANWTWRFGCSSRDWIAHSTNQATTVAACGHTAYSEKYRKVFISGNADQGGVSVYDPRSNAHSDRFINERYTVRPVNSDSTAGVITNGHDAHLFIMLGRQPNNFPFSDVCLYVIDLDEMESWTANPVPTAMPDRDGPMPYAVMNANAARQVANGLGGWLLKLLTPAIQFTPDAAFPGYWPSLAWDRKRGRLLLWNAPPAVVYGGSQPIVPQQLYTITIPTGTTNGVANWKTQPWQTANPQLTLARGVAGIHQGVVSSMYKRFSWHDGLDCAIVAGCPETLPVQAFSLAD
jgi:hypothetical protein